MWNIYLYFIILKLSTNFQNIILLDKIVANAPLRIHLKCQIYYEICSYYEMNTLIWTELHLPQFKFNLHKVLKTEILVTCLWESYNRNNWDYCHASPEILIALKVCHLMYNVQDFAQILYSRNEAHMWATKVNELNTSTYKRKQQKYYSQLRQTRRILTDLLLSCKPLIWPRFLRMQLTLLVTKRSRMCSDL